MKESIVKKMEKFTQWQAKYLAGNPNAKQKVDAKT
jgi:hypothetical protein